MKMQSTEMIENNVSSRGKCLSGFCVLVEETELGDPLIEGPQAVKLFILKPTLTTLCAIWRKNIIICSKPIPCHIYIVHTCMIAQQPSVGGICMLQPTTALEKSEAI